MDSSDPGSSWTFLTNHARILIMIAREPRSRLRDIAASCGITERTVQAIVADLEAGGYLTHTREGRRNLYQVTQGTRFRHAAEADHEIVGLLALINGRPAAHEPGTGEHGADAEAAEAAKADAADADADGRAAEPAGAPARSADGG